MEEIYNINIVDYIEQIDNDNIYYKFSTDNNYDEIYLKDLCILANINNSHYSKSLNGYNNNINLDKSTIKKIKWKE